MLHSTLTGIGYQVRIHDLRPALVDWTSTHVLGVADTGSMDASQFEREIRHQPYVARIRHSQSIADRELAWHASRMVKDTPKFLTNEGIEHMGDHYKRKTKAANAKCVCGSGKKVALVLCSTPGSLDSQR